MERLSGFVFLACYIAIRALLTSSLRHTVSWGRPRPTGEALMYLSLPTKVFGGFHGSSFLHPDHKFSVIVGVAIKHDRITVVLIILKILFGQSHTHTSVFFRLDGIMINLNQGDWDWLGHLSHSIVCVEFSQLCIRH